MRQRGVGLVVASAGSGKSVLLEQWAGARTDLCVCTVRLSHRHNDASVFAGAVLNALAAAPQPIDAHLAGRRIVGGDGLGEPFVEGLLAELQAQETDLVLVFDDLHLVTNTTLLSELEQLIERLPDNVRLVLATRWDPPMRLGWLRLEGRLVEVRGADLAFDRGEAAALLRSTSGTELSDSQAAILVDRTDGWAAGLRLAAISLEDTDDPTHFVEAFSGSDRLVVEYLTQEVFATLDSTTRRFLLLTSVLPWLSIDLCDAVTGGDDAATMLADLERRCLFVTRLDGGDSRLRYHQLFADLLRDQLRAEDPRLVDDLRWKSSQWLGANGHVEDAVEQLLAAGDHWSAFGMLLDHGQEIFERSESSDAGAVAGRDRPRASRRPTARRRQPARSAGCVTAVRRCRGDPSSARSTHRPVWGRTSHRRRPLLVSRAGRPPWGRDHRGGIRGVGRAAAPRRRGDRRLPRDRWPGVHRVDGRVHVRARASSSTRRSPPAGADSDAPPGCPA